MKQDIEELRRLLDQIQIPDDQKRMQVELLNKIDKNQAKLDFRLERAQKEKNTIAKLLSRTSEDLEKSSELIRKIFGRYLSPEVMQSLLHDPSALELGGERRAVTLMMTDLRGFSSLSERLHPEQVVRLLNSYFEVMVDVIIEFGGTINEIIGDALLVIFGAPKQIPDRIDKAVACAVSMQNAMQTVNQRNIASDLPELKMGIGLNDTEVIVGNIGSSKRSKYAVVGSGVNVTSRIESYTVGGQILVSESIIKAIRQRLRIDGFRDVFPKGSEKPMRVYQIGGISGHYNLVLNEERCSTTKLAREISIECTVIEGKDIGSQKMQGRIVALAESDAEILLSAALNPMTNVKMNLLGVGEQLLPGDFYGKIVASDAVSGRHNVKFTSLPPEIHMYFLAYLQHVTEPRMR